MSFRLPIRVLNLAVLVASGIAAGIGLDANRPPELAPVAFHVALVGEREMEPGLWEGLDLTDGNTAIAPHDRLQLSLRLSHPGYLWAFAIDARNRVVRIGGEENGSLEVVPGVAYALPNPREFFAVADGPVQIVVVVAVQRQPSLDAADLDAGTLRSLLIELCGRSEVAEVGRWNSRLSDGSETGARMLRVSGRAAAAWDVVLPGRGAGGLAAPPKVDPWSNTAALEAARTRAG